jgi:hypothetical protein
MDESTVTPVPLLVVVRLYEEARALGYDGPLMLFLDFFAPIEEEWMYI